MALSVSNLVFLVTDQVPTFPEWHSALIFDMEGTKSSHHDRMAQPLHLTYSSEWLWILALISNMEGTKSSHHDRMAWPLYLTCSSEWLPNLSLLLGRDPNMENTKILPEVLKLHSGQWLHQHTSYLFIHHNILELHYSSLHHNPDIVIFDL